MPRSTSRFSCSSLSLLALVTLGSIACRPSADPAGPESVVAVAATPPAPPTAPTLPVISQDPGVQRIFELGTTQNHAHVHLQTLVDDIGPRLTSSHNLMRAEQWARDQFAQWGLDARLEEWGEWPVGFDRGPWSGRMVTPTSQPLEFVTDAWTPGVHGPVRGKAVLAPTTLKEAKAGAKAGAYKGAWLVKPVPTRGQRADPKERDAMAETVREGGMLGYVGSDRDAKGELVHTSGDHDIDWSKLPQDVSVKLRADQHADILRRVEANEAVELEFSIDNRFFRGPVKLYNVVADIPGTERPDEYVIVGGHIDSWDGADGAVDNGTGVATTMEAARLIAQSGLRPKRTIRFMLWSGEEQGLWGSRRYVERNPELMDKISAVFVHDGGTNYLAGLGITPEMLPQMQQVTAPLTQIAPQERPFQLYVIEEMEGGGSDHSPFISAGVPGFFWVQGGRSIYRCMHHTQHDTIAAVIPEYQQHSSVVAAITAWNVANLPDLLDRTHAAPIGGRTEIGIELDGIRLASVKPGSTADKAGWKAGDEFVSVNDVKIESMRDLWRASSQNPDTWSVVLKRGKKKVKSVIDRSGGQEVKDAKTKRQQEREQRFGPEVLNGPKPDPRAVFGDPNASCQPGHGAPATAGL